MRVDPPIRKSRAIIGGIVVVIPGVLENITRMRRHRDRDLRWCDLKPFLPCRREATSLSPCGSSSGQDRLSFVHVIT